MKKYKLPIVVGIAFCLVALGFFLFPTINNYISQLDNKSVISAYSESVNSLSEEQKSYYLNQAKEYNNSLANLDGDYSNYDNILSFADGQIGTIVIPSIDVNLPIYHDSEDNMTKGAIHSKYSSFPIGGADTHSIVSAHTAYPGKEFFDNLTEMNIGELFYIHILDEVLVYKVIDINIIDPSDDTLLQIQEGKDLVTLLTCYPYSVNTHRLLVTGERTETPTEEVSDTQSDEQQSISNYIPLIAIMITGALILVIAIVIIRKFSIKRRKKLEN